MAKLNKGQAMEAVINRVTSDNEVNGADPRDLRLMTFEQRNESIRRVFAIKHGEFLENVIPAYRAEVEQKGRQLISRKWNALVSDLEDTDPVLVAERQARAFVMTVDRMIADANEVLARFMEHFKSNPAYAFQSTQSVQAAADLDIATRAKRLLETMSPTEVKARLVDSLHYDSGFRLEGSTCPMTNLVDRAKGIATMKLAGLRS